MPTLLPPSLPFPSTNAPPSPPRKPHLPQPFLVFRFFFFCQGSQPFSRPLNTIAPDFFAEYGPVGGFCSTRLHLPSSSLNCFSSFFFSICLHGPGHQLPIFTPRPPAPHSITFLTRPIFNSPLCSQILKIRNFFSFFFFHARCPDPNPFFPKFFFLFSLLFSHCTPFASQFYTTLLCFTL